MHPSSWPDSLKIQNPGRSYFPGFSQEAFALLARLKSHPHIERYRQEKPEIRRYLQSPFAALRDELTIRWVLPHQLPLETERNVFSRLLKNDFGAGGCHYHYWMAFYRIDRKRLSDIQLSFSLWPDSFRIHLYLPTHTPHLTQPILQQLTNEPDFFLDMLNTLPSTYQWIGYTSTHSFPMTLPSSRLPSELVRSKGFRITATRPRSEVIDAPDATLHWTLETIQTLWPLYRYLQTLSSYV